MAGRDRWARRKKSKQKNFSGRPGGGVPTLDDAFAQEFVFTSEQILHKNVAALIHVTRCSSKMMIDSHPRGSAEIVCNRDNLIRGFSLAEQPLRIRTRRADSKQFRRDSDKSGKEKLFAVQFRTKPRHGVKQTPRESLASARGVIDMPLLCRVQIVDLARAV
jgi:hypothetical protein